MKPLIALSSRDRQVNNTEAYYLQESYMNALSTAGATYIGIVPVSDHDYDHIAQMCDGLLVCGGKDIDSCYFDEPLHEKASLVKKSVDEMDFHLVEAFLKHNKPILGICRGHQVLNVYYGGSMIQDIPTQAPSELVHSQSEARNVGTHEVQLTEDSFLGKAGEIHLVNSFHHQAINRVGNTLKVVAKSEDGIIEAIENEHVMGVQWHPECMIQEDFHLAIIQKFVNKCKKN